MEKPSIKYTSQRSKSNWKNHSFHYIYNTKVGNKFWKIVILLVAVVVVVFFLLSHSGQPTQSAQLQRLVVHHGSVSIHQEENTITKFVRIDPSKPMGKARGLFRIIMEKGDQNEFSPTIPGKKLDVETMVDRYLLLCLFFLTCVFLHPDRVSGLERKSLYVPSLVLKRKNK